MVDATVQTSLENTPLVGPSRAGSAGDVTLGIKPKIRAMHQALMP